MLGIFLCGKFGFDKKWEHLIKRIKFQLSSMRVGKACCVKLFSGGKCCGD